MTAATRTRTRERPALRPSSPSLPLLLPLLLLATCGSPAAAMARARPQPFPAHTQLNQGDACVAPDGKPGVCRLIRDCPHMLGLLQGRPSQSDIILLNRARCGFQGSVPIVCCAGQTLPTPRPTPPTPRPVPPSDNSGDDEVPRDVSNHPNLRLLPQERCSPGGTDRIVGGKVADVYAYPWIARLGYKSRSRPNNAPSYRCGGSLVSDRYVLTAAHCVLVKSDLRLTTVKLGEHTIDTPRDCRTNNSGCIPPPIDVDVEQTIVHPSYDSGKMHHDIALLRLARRVDIVREEFVRPVCLPVGFENQNMELDGVPLVVAGWGTTDTETGETTLALLDVYVPAVTLSRCRESYRKLSQQTVIIPQQLCAGGVKGRDSCTGDSGGPLMHEADVDGETKTVQFGVVSYGPRMCGTPDVPGVYTRIAYYMQWILDTMRP